MRVALRPSMAWRLFEDLFQLKTEEVAFSNATGLAFENARSSNWLGRETGQGY